MILLLKLLVLGFIIFLGIYSCIGFVRILLAIRNEYIKGNIYFNLSSKLLIFIVYCTILTIILFILIIILSVAMSIIITI